MSKIDHNNPETESTHRRRDVLMMFGAGAAVAVLGRPVASAMADSTLTDIKGPAGVSNQRPAKRGPKSTTTTQPSTTSIAPTTTAAPSSTAPLVTVPASTAPPGSVVPATSVAPAGPGGGGSAIGGRPFRASSLWNTPIPSGAQWRTEPVLQNKIDVGDGNGLGSRHWYMTTGNVGVVYARNTDPVWTLDLGRHDYAVYGRNRQPEIRQVHCPDNVYIGEDSDGIMSLVNSDTGEYVEMWRAVRTGAPRTLQCQAWGDGNIITGTGMPTRTVNAGVRASNFSWIAGMITKHDLEAPSIDHALVCAMGPDVLDCLSWISPATAPDGGYARGPIPQGIRIGIPDAPTPAGLDPLELKLWNCVKTYGIFVGDFSGGPWPVLYTDKLTVDMASVDSLYAWWNGKVPVLDKMIPHMRIMTAPLPIIP